jgi:hypothetical protein
MEHRADMKEQSETVSPHVYPSMVMGAAGCFAGSSTLLPLKFYTRYIRCKEKSTKAMTMDIVSSVFLIPSTQCDHTWQEHLLLDEHILWCLNQVPAHDGT